MVPKSGSKLPFSQPSLSDSELAAHIGNSLTKELGASRRATKTVMAWTGVSDHTARSWLNGRTSPSGLHLIELATRSDPVMLTVLKLTGHENLALGLDLRVIERRLEQALVEIRAMQRLQ